MIDPLSDFPWSRLSTLYDATCVGFDQSSPYLPQLAEKPSSDQELYLTLIGMISATPESRLIVDFDAYLGILYWKLYSNAPALGNVPKKLITDSSLQRETSDKLTELISRLPEQISPDHWVILGLINFIRSFRIIGMGGESLAMQTTFLHFCYPTVVPIFDVMVLRAVGIKDPKAKRSISVLSDYLPHSWALAERYGAELRRDEQLSAVRQIDMALWVSRGGSYRQ